MKLYTEDGDFGPRLILQGQWKDGIADFMRKNCVTELKANSWNGFQEKSAAFVKHLPFLVGLFLFIQDVEDLDSVLELQHLRAFHNSGYDKTTLDFTRLAKLEKLHVHWHKGIQSLFRCENLQVLHLDQYNGKSFNDFKPLINLEVLDLVSRTIHTSDGLEDLERLKKLSIAYMSKLNSLRGIENLKRLKWLHIQSCKNLNNIEWISELPNLTTLLIDNCGDIDSLGPLKKLTKLEHISFIDSTNIKDGDISMLSMLPNLKDAHFQDRKHYSCKRMDFPQTSLVWRY